MNWCRSRGIVVTVIVQVLLCALAIAAIATFSGKVVSVSDGDTISIIRDGRSVRIRLDGIDCPELGQDFGTKAKQFTSNLVFGKEVTAEIRDVDKYGRLVCRVFIDSQDLSLALVKAGLAWHYKQYSSDSVLAEAETAAKEAKAGLWSMSSPTSPWDFRHGKASDGTNQPAAITTSDRAMHTANAGTDTVYITNSGKKYHAAGCRYLARSQIPISLADAKARGYTACSVCGGGASESVSTGSASTQAGASLNRGNNPNQDEIVYITRTGTKYHRAGCSSLRKSAIPISKKDAVARGYSPCKRCNP